jgi:hypothetical protein
MKNKVGMVMKEFKRGDLKSSSGQKVTNPKQAMAIALSEAGKSKKGSDMKKMAAGGMPMVEKDGTRVPAFAADGKGKMAKGGRIASKGEHSVQTKSKRGAEMVKMAKGGHVYKKDADGVAKKGRTSVTEVKMARGGLSKAEVKKADAAGRKVTRDLKYDDMKDKMMGMKKGGMTKKMRSGGKTC